MFITKYFQIIHLTVPSSWIATIIAFILSYGAVRVIYGKNPANLLADAMFYFVIVWKLSVIITDFKTVIQFPLSIVYFNGGRTGVFLGVLAVAIFAIIELKKKAEIYRNLFPLIFGSIVVFSTYQIAIALMNEGPQFARLMTISLFALFMISSFLLRDRLEDMPTEWVFLMIGLQLFMSAIQPAGILQTITIVTVIFGGMFLLFINRRKKYLEAIH